MAAEFESGYKAPTKKEIDIKMGALEIDTLKGQRDLPYANSHRKDWNNPRFRLRFLEQNEIVFQFDMQEVIDSVTK